LSVLAVEQADGGPPPSTSPLSLGAAEIGTTYIYGKLVLFFSPGTESDAGPSRVGTLNVWSAPASAPKSIASTVLEPVAYYPYAASGDGRYLLYLGNVASDGATASLILADLQAGTKKTLLSSIDVRADGCQPGLGFSGTYAVASYCVMPSGAAGDAGSGPIATVASFDETTGAATTLATNVYSGFAFDANGVAAVMVGAGGLVASPISGAGGLVTIDTAGSSGFLSSDGAEVVYATTDKALKRANTSAPVSASELVPGGFAGVDALSSDGSWTIGHLNAGKNGATDLFAASALSAGSAIMLSTETTASATTAGDAFTADSTYALYLTGLTTNFTGTLDAYPLAAGGPAVMVGSGTWEAYATQGSQIVYNQNDANAKADLAWMDLSVPGSLEVIVSQAGQYFLLGPAKDQIVYTFAGSPGGSLDGLWIVPVPGGTQVADCAGAGGPISFHPPGASKSCTGGEVTTFDSACISADATGCASVGSVISSACYGCLYSPLTSSRWGVVLDNPAGGGLYQLNAAACFTNQGDGPCSVAVQALRACENNVCAAQTTQATFETCRSNADRATCACYSANINPACAAVSSSSVCIVPDSDSFEEAFLALAAATCE
jgi:hypothetical protein